MTLRGNLVGGEVPLYFVMAPSYHASTLLALLLNNHPDLSSLGDTLPHRRLYPNQRCGCEARVRDCSFWQEVHQRLDADRFAHSDFMIPAYPEVSKDYRINSVVARSLTALSLSLGPGVWKLAPRASSEFLETFLHFGEVICELQQSRIFVNNVKSFTSLLALRSLLGKRARIRVIHLIRDPRGYFLSERKQNPAVTPRASGRRWLAYHRRVEWLKHYTGPEGYFRLRYEDLCDDGEAALAQLCRFLEVEPQPMCLPVVYPEKNHVLGNVTRLDFDGQIRPSLGWIEATTAEEQRQVLAATRPLSQACGYS